MNCGPGHSDPLLSRFSRERGDPGGAWGVRVCTPDSARPSPPTASRWAPPLPRAGEGVKGAALLLRLPFLLLVAAGLALAAKGVWIPAKAELAQLLLERAFAEGRAAGRPARAWPWADSAPVARLSVPRLGSSEIVLSGGSGEALAFGPTHLPASAAIGGRGTAVFAAHRDTHFRFLKNLRPGDSLAVETLDGRTLRYRIASARVVRSDLYVPSGDLALVTCWPFGATERGPLRYVVTARRLN